MHRELHVVKARIPLSTLKCDYFMHLVTLYAMVTQQLCVNYAIVCFNNM